jgi:acetyl esterase
MLNVDEPQGSGKPSILIENVTIPGPHGAMSLRTYLPDGATVGYVWAHGGAYSLGGLDQVESDQVARELAGRGIAVVAVGYRLAPVPEWMAPIFGEPERDGVHYPVALEEVKAAFTWATTWTQDVAADRWSLGGASAGATLAVGATLQLRDEGSVLPSTLLLSYGSFHATVPRPSAELATKWAALPAHLTVLNSDLIKRINLNYVTEPDELSAPYSFGGGKDLTGLPPTFLLHADADSLRASGEQFATELVAAGVDVLSIREPESLHGYLNDPGPPPEAVRSFDRMAVWLLSDLIY